MNNLISLCTTDAHVDEFYECLVHLQDDDLCGFSQRDDVSAEFLHAVFFCAENISDEIRKLFAQHVSAPDSVVLMCLKYFPDWVEKAPSLTVRQARATGACDTSWEETVAAYLAEEKYVNVFSKQWRLWLPFMKIEPKSKPDCWKNRTLMGSKLAPRIVSAVLDKSDIKDIVGAIDFLDTENHTAIVTHSNYKVRLLALKHLCLSSEHMEQLAFDKSASVRKNVASHKGLSDQTVVNLLAHKDAGLDAALLANQSLSKGQQLTVATARVEMIEKVDSIESSVTDALRTLKDVYLTQDILLAHAKHVNPVVRCVCAMHNAADKNVIQLILSDEVEWVKGAVAYRTSNVDIMAQLSRSTDLDVLRHLSNNRNLPVSIAIEILNSTFGTDEQVRLGLAGMHVHDNTFMEALRATRVRATAWEKDLDIALLETTRKETLSRLHNKPSRGELCVSRAIARHVNCPARYLPIFMSGIPEDAMANPANLMDALEGTQIAQDTYPEWLLRKRIHKGKCHAFITNSYCLQSQLKYQRLASTCRFVHPVLLDRVAIIDDGLIQRRLVERGVSHLTRFAIELLSYSKRPTIRKLLLEQDNLPVDVIERLCSDEDRSVQLVALRSAKKAGLTVKNLEICEVSKTGSLGNKAVRLELAVHTQDAAIVERLVFDKVVDVRRALAKRCDLTNDMLLHLCNDSDQKVAVDAILAIKNVQLTTDQNADLQRTLVDTLRNESSATWLKSICIDLVEDKHILDELYNKGALKELSNIIAPYVKTSVTIDKLMLDFKNKRTCERSFLALLKNPQLSLEQTRDIVEYAKLTEEQTLDHISNASNCMTIIKEMDLKSLFNNNDPTLKPDFTVQQLNELLALHNKFIRFLAMHTHKLPDEIVIGAVESLPRGSLKRMCSVSGWKEPVYSWLFEWAYASDEHSNKEHDLQGPLCRFVTKQKLTDKQIPRLMNHDDSDVKRCLANHHSAHLCEEHLLQLACDNDFEVRWNVLGNCYETDHFPQSVLQMLGKDKDKEIKNDARARLRELGIELESSNDRNSMAISHLLKKSNAPLSAVKANQKLLELGILEECQRESTSKPGQMRTFKKLTQKGDAFGKTILINMVMLRLCTTRMRFRSC